MIKGFTSYPKTVEVEGMNWAIKFKRKPFYDDEGDECLGLCDPEDKTIYIKIQTDKVDMFRVFIHEVLHAIEYEREIEIPHKYIEKLDRGVSKFLIKNFNSINKIVDKN